jgi:hypothetical protein
MKGEPEAVMPFSNMQFLTEMVLDASIPEVHSVHAESPSDVKRLSAGMHIVTYTVLLDYLN